MNASSFPSWTTSALIALLTIAVSPTQAATTIVDYTVNSTIPDNNPIGLADNRVIIGSPVASITSVEVRLIVSGGWNGDLYAHLSHSSGFSVLLNRPGRTSLDTVGSASSGFNITFTDDAFSDIHTLIPGSGLVTGSWQPDAREIDPDLVVDTDPRTAYLSNFQGLSPDGTWTLFVADNSASDESTLIGWGLTILGTPEPSRAMLMMLGSLGLMMRRRRSIA